MKKYLYLILGVAMGFSFSSCDKENKTPKVDELVSVKDFKFDEASNQDDLNKITAAIKAYSLDEVVEPAKTELAGFKAQAKVIDKEVQAEKGKAGYIMQGKDKKRLVNANGVEIEQVFKKGFIGAYQLNGLNNAMKAMLATQDKAVREAELNKAVVYLLGERKFNKTKKDFKNDGNSFGKYLMSVTEQDEFKGIDQDLYKAFIKAYANLEKDEVLKEALATINKCATTVVAVRGVHYIYSYTAKLRAKGMSDGEVVHELSEGLGFVYALQFASKFPKEGMYYTAEEANAVANANLWDEATDKSGKSLLDNNSAKIAELFGFDPAKA